MRLIAKDAKANMAQVEQQRKRRDEKTTKPRRFPINPKINNIIHIQSITTMSISMLKTIFAKQQKRMLNDSRKKENTTRIDGKRKRTSFIDAKKKKKKNNIQLMPILPSQN